MNYTLIDSASCYSFKNIFFVNCVLFGWFTDITIFAQVRCHRGVFRGSAPLTTARAPPSDNRAPKENNWPGATGAYLGGLYFPEREYEVLFQDEKHEWTPKQSLSFFYFWSSLLYLWARTEILTIRLSCTPPGYERALPSENYFGMNTFFSFFWSLLPNLIKNLSVPSKYFFYPPVTLLWRRACIYKNYLWYLKIFFAKLSEKTILWRDKVTPDQNFRGKSCFKKVY